MKVTAKVRPTPERTEKGKDGKEVKIPASKGGEVTVDYNFPANLADATKAFGEDVVYAHMKGSVIISLQAGLRRLIDGGKSPAECQAFAKEYKPDVRTVVKQTAYEKASGAIKSMSAEDRAKLLKELQGVK